MIKLKFELSIDEYDSLNELSTEENSSEKTEKKQEETIKDKGEKPTPFE